VPIEQRQCCVGQQVKCIRVPKDIHDAPHDRALLRSWYIGRVVQESIRNCRMVPFRTPENKSFANVHVVSYGVPFVRGNRPAPRSAHDRVHTLVVHTCRWLSQDVLNLPDGSREFVFGNRFIVSQPAKCFEKVMDVL
jgi:hypothetical protein